MKVLTLLIAPLVLFSLGFAKESDVSLEAYISKNKRDGFSYDYQKNEAQSSILRDSWIAPVSLQYSYSRSNPSSSEQTYQNAYIKMDQPIFQSGGIYYGIKYADASRIYSDYSIDVAKRKLVKDAISLLMQIKQSDLQIQRQNLQIKNSEINLELKKEQYLNGQLDSGFLDDAIIERNNAIQSLYDIQTSKEKLISRFNAISDKDYKYAIIPHLELLNEEQFLKYNISLDLANAQVDRDGYNKKVTQAKYLPRISVTAGYNWDKTQDQVLSSGSKFDSEKDYYNYGFKVYMPLDINSFKDMEVARVEYLKSRVVVEDEKREQIALFEQVMQNIENFDKKIALSRENSDIYEKLLTDTRVLFEAGYKTDYDVQTLENSVKIQERNSEIYEIDKQLEILNLYEMYKNEQ